MESWQKKYIIGNLTSFIQDIDCNMILIGHLVQVGVLSNADVAKLKAVGDTYEKNYLLLEILQTRTGAYKHLAKACYNSKQTGALLKLLVGIEWHLPNENPFVFCDIELNTNEILLSHGIIEGAKLPLKDICSSIEKTHMNTLISRGLDASSYHSVINGEPITIANSTVPNSLPYYIPRTLSTNTKLDPKIFTNLHDDIFCVEGVEIHQLSALANAGGRSSSRRRNTTPDLSRNQVHRVTSCFIVLENATHFQAIANKTDEVVHWIRYMEGDYLYVKSSPGNGIKGIQSFLTHQTRETLSQENFLQTNLDVAANEPILFFDSPGMGKSVLLAEMARNVKKARPDRNVIYFPLPELIPKITILGRNFDSSNLKQSLTKVISGNGLGQTIMKNLFDLSTHRVELFLDAYDEIPQSEIGTVNKILDCIAKQCKNFRMWITARPHRRHELEERFGIPGYNILPFDASNKLSFFLKYWENQHHVIITEQIKGFAEHCLKSLATRMPSKKTDIAGIPLQCKMLADIFAEDAKRGGLVCTETHLQFNSLYEMYKTYMDTKFDSLSSDAEKKLLKEFHVREAIRTLFSIKVAMKITGRGCNQVDNETIYKLGILESNMLVPAGLQFVHRTFAEFLAAEYLVTSAVHPLVNEQMTQTIDLLFGYAIATREYKTTQAIYCVYVNHFFMYPVIVQFVDFFLSTTHTASTGLRHLKHFIIRSEYNNLDRFLKLIFASVNSNTAHLFFFLCDIFLNLGKSSDSSLAFIHFPFSDKWAIQDSEKLLCSLKQRNDLKYLVFCSAQRCSLELVKLVCEFVDLLTGKQWHEYSDIGDSFPLYSAAKRGHFQIVEYLLSFGVDSLYDEELLSCCLRESSGDSLDVINGKLQIVKLILQASPDLLHKPHPKYKVVPLLTFECHFELIKCLIEAGADLTATYQSGRNVATSAASYFSPEEYHNFTLLMISRDTTKIFRQRDRKGYTPVHWALRNIELKTETLELLSNRCRVTFNDNNNVSGKSELTFAFTKLRSQRVINDIIRFGGRRWHMYNIFWATWHFIRKRFD